MSKKLINEIDDVLNEKEEIKIEAGSGADFMIKKFGWKVIGVFKNKKDAYKEFSKHDALTASTTLAPATKDKDVNKPWAVIK